jgi:hypothetical protein
MNPDNATVPIDHLAEYWELAKWALLVIGVVVIVIAAPMRRPGKAFGVLLLGLYATVVWYFMTSYQHFGYDVEVAVGLVVLVGLFVLGVFYYLVFIRTSMK